MIRRATIDDLPAVAKIHMDCFRGTVTTRLGRLWNGKVVEDYYKEYFNDSPELFLVAENDSGKVIGYAMGFTLESGNIDKLVIKHHFLSIILGFCYLLIKGDKECWRKFKSIFIRKEENEVVKIIDPKVDRLPKGEIARFYTMGVFEDYRGQHYGKALTEAYFEACRKIGKTICLIHYISENTRAERLYYKLGCKPYIENGNYEKICYKEL